MRKRVNSGESIYVVQDLLGHSSPRMTQRYSHLAPQIRRRAADVVGQLVEAAATRDDADGGRRLGQDAQQDHPEA